MIYGKVHVSVSFCLGLCSLGVPVFTLQIVVSVCHKMSEVT